MENLDVFDELYTPLTPPTASIDDVHTKGLWHQTFACWLVNKDKGTVILQLRGPRNRIDPGSFDASASGHLSAGETPNGGFRELEEELGVTIAEPDRIYLGIHRNIAIRGAYINHEFCHIYLAGSNHSLEDFTLQEGEVDGAFEIAINDAIKLFSGEINAIKAKGLHEEKTITVQDMCNYKERTKVSNYYLKVMLAAKGFLNNNQILAI